MEGGRERAMPPEKKQKSRRRLIAAPAKGSGIEGAAALLMEFVHPVAVRVKGGGLKGQRGALTAHELHQIFGEGRVQDQQRPNEMGGHQIADMEALLLALGAAAGAAGAERCRGSGGDKKTARRLNTAAPLRSGGNKL